MIKKWKKYRRSTLGFWEVFFGGHKSLGPITIYGENAMHWAINISTRWGYFCFRLPLRCFVFGGLCIFIFLQMQLLRAHLLSFQKVMLDDRT